MNSTEDEIADLELRIKSITEELGWSYDELRNNQEIINIVSCPFDSAHKMPETSFKEHTEKCSWKFEDYLSDECPLSEPVPGPSSLLLTVDLQEEILRKAASEVPNFSIGGDFRRPVPKTANRWQVGFTQDERLAIYDYVVEQTKRKGELKQANFGSLESQTASKEMTALELAAAQRDAKRRRATYRHKVHTGSKNHIEVLREVIQSQMTQLCEDIKEEEQEVAATQETTKESPEKKHHERDLSDNHDKKQSRRDVSRFDRYHKSYRRSRSRDRHKYDGYPDVSRDRDRSGHQRCESDHRRRKEGYRHSSAHGEKQKERKNEESSSRKRHRTDDVETLTNELASGDCKQLTAVNEGPKEEGSKSLTDDLFSTISFWELIPRREHVSNDDEPSQKKKKKERKRKKEKKRKKKKRRKSSDSSSSSSS